MKTLTSMLIALSTIFWLLTFSSCTKEDQSYSELDTKIASIIDQHGLSDKVILHHENINKIVLSDDELRDLDTVIGLLKEQFPNPSADSQFVSKKMELRRGNTTTHSDVVKGANKEYTQKCM